MSKMKHFQSKYEVILTYIGHKKNKKHLYPKIKEFPDINASKSCNMSKTNYL